MNIISAQPHWFVLVTRDDDATFSMILQVPLWLQEGQKAIPMVAHCEEVVRIEVVIDKLKKAALAKSEEIKVMYQLKYIEPHQHPMGGPSIGGSKIRGMF